MTTPESYRGYQLHLRHNPPVWNVAIQRDHEALPELRAAERICACATLDVAIADARLRIDALLDP